MRARHPRGVEEGSGGEEFGVHGLLWVCPFAGWRIVEVTRDYKEKDRPVAFPVLLLSDRGCLVVLKFSAGHIGCFTLI